MKGEFEENFSKYFYLKPYQRENMEFLGKFPKDFRNLGIVFEKSWIS